MCTPSIHVRMSVAPFVPPSLDDAMKNEAAVAKVCWRIRWCQSLHCLWPNVVGCVRHRIWHDCVFLLCRPRLCPLSCQLSGRPGYVCRGLRPCGCGASAGRIVSEGGHSCVLPPPLSRFSIMHPLSLSLSLFQTIFAALSVCLSDFQSNQFIRSHPPLSRRGTGPSSGHSRAEQSLSQRGPSPSAWDDRYEAPRQPRRQLLSSVCTRHRAVNQGKSGVSVGTTHQRKGKGRSGESPMNTTAYGGKGQGK